MNLQNRALLIAAGVGAVIQSILAAISALAAGSSQAQLFADPAAFDPAAVSGLAGVSTLICCCAIFLDGGIGTLYAYLHKQSMPLEMQDGVAGGALSAGLARIVSGLVGACLSLAILPALGQTALGGAEFLALGVGGAVGALIGTCINFIIGAVLGAIGGAIGTAIFGREKAM